MNDPMNDPWNGVDRDRAEEVVKTEYAPDANSYFFFPYVTKPKELGYVAMYDDCIITGSKAMHQHGGDRMRIRGPIFDFIKAELSKG